MHFCNISRDSLPGSPFFITLSQTTDASLRSSWVGWCKDGERLPQWWQFHRFLKCARNCFTAHVGKPALPDVNVLKQVYLVLLCANVMVNVKGCKQICGLSSVIVIVIFHLVAVGLYIFNCISISVFHFFFSISESSFSVQSPNAREWPVFYALFCWKLSQYKYWLTSHQCTQCTYYKCTSHIKQSRESYM